MSTSNGIAPWILEDAERALRDGLLLHQWWKRTDAANSYRNAFPLLDNLEPPDRAIGFFDQATITSGPIPVLGYAHQMAFDTPKAGSPELHRDQLREFVFRYLMRVAEVTPPQPKNELGFGPLTGSLFELLRLGPPRTVVHRGFEYTQICYKDANGEVYPFPEHRQADLIDLRTLGTDYKWVVMRARPYDYELDVAPVGPAGPRLVLPLPDSPTIVLSRDWIVNEDHPAPGVLARFGFGYALLDDPTPRGVQVYGPAQFRACFQTIHFEVLESGQSRAGLSFTGNLPERILDVKLDPIGLTLKASDWLSRGWSDRLLRPVQPLIDMRPKLPGFDPLLGFLSVANIATAGLASRGFDISRDQLFRDVLVSHFNIYHQLIVNSLLAYQQVPDWFNHSHLPAWAQHPSVDAVAAHA